MKPAASAPTGLPAVDRLATLNAPTLDDYLDGVSEYVRLRTTITDGQAKAAQIRLSGALGSALADELEDQLDDKNASLYAGERNVSGALRVVRADVSEFHQLDGLRLAIEIKPVNLAVGRAIWNRFGDIRTFAVNLHLKFPFAVVGGLLVFPTFETVKGKPKDTTHLINRAVDRLSRAGGRKTEGDAPHLLEGVGVVVYDPASGQLDPATPPSGSGLRWDEFIEDLATAYNARFGE
jgi:hypothetical protein